MTNYTENFYTNLNGWSGNMPEVAIKKLNKSIEHQWKVCFFAVLIVGMFAHFYKITNWLPNWDSLVFRYDSQNMLPLGRWFLPVVCSVTSFYDLPYLNGLIAIIMHAIGSVLICKMFGVKKDITAFLIGAVIVSFPSVTSVLMYNYVADGYSIAFLFCCIAGCLITQKKPKYILSVCLITLSVAIYQAYITVIIVLLIAHLSHELIFEKRDVKYLLKKAACYFATGLFAMILYTVILNLLLKITGTQLLEYQGINSSNAMTNINIPGTLYTVKHSISGFFFDFENGLSLFTTLNVIIFAITICIYCVSAYKNKVLRSPVKIAIIAILVVGVVFGSTVLALINPGVDYHNLMLMGYIVFYIFFIVLYEKGLPKSSKGENLQKWTVFVISLLIILNQIVIANVSYHKAQIAYEKSYGTLIRIADRIEQTENAENCNEIVVIGALDGSKEYSVDLPPDMTGITNGFIIRADDEIVGQSVFCSALNDYCHKHYSFLSGNRKQYFVSNPVVKDMDIWPGKGSVAVVDNVLVIKLGAESE